MEVTTASGTDTLRFLYENGSPIGYLLNESTPFFYVKNLAGDITAVVTEGGAVAAEYCYDSWGNLVDAQGDSAVLAINPLTYRGYLYDGETGLYYLQTRYYNPQWCRFINADTNLDTGTSIIGTNLFAYCDNNPVMGVDYTGEEAVSIGAIIVFAFIASVWVYYMLGSTIIGFVGELTPEIDWQIEHRYGINSITFLAMLAFLMMLASKTAETIETTIQKVIERINNKPVFPSDPSNFNPIGLTPAFYRGSDNGRIIKWFLGKQVVFEWNEDLRIGSHYHVYYGSIRSPIHYWSGYLIPEPFASICF